MLRVEVSVSDVSEVSPHGLPTEVNRVRSLVLPLGHHHRGGAHRGVHLNLDPLHAHVGVKIS